MKIENPKNPTIICKECNTIIIINLNKWLEENPKEQFLQCLYCDRIIRIK